MKFCTVTILNIVIASSVLVMSSCASPAFKSEVQHDDSLVDFETAGREPAWDQPTLSRSLKHFLKSWNESKVCSKLLQPQQNVSSAAKMFLPATELSDQLRRSGQNTIADLILAEARFGGFLDTTDPKHFLDELNDVILKEKEKPGNAKLSPVQFENQIELISKLLEARIGHDGILPKELRGPLNFLTETTQANLADALKTVSHEELVILEQKIEQLYVKEGDQGWKNSFEEAFNSCR